jgi:hypothetical protein
MPNGDIVSACSDGVVRVFSESEERWASQQDLKEYDDQVAGHAISSQQVGDVKKSDLPGLDALNTPGTSLERSFFCLFVVLTFVQERSRVKSKWLETAPWSRPIRCADRRL